MKLRILSGLVLLAASVFAQQTPSRLNRFQAFQGMTKQQALDTVAQTTKVPKLSYAENYFVLPQVADGTQAGQGVWTTEFHIVNLDPAHTASFELDFYNANGTPATFLIAGPTFEVSSISGTLNPGEMATYVTAGLPKTVQTGWAALNVNTTGAYVSAYETINLYNPAENYLSSVAGPSDFGVDGYNNQPGTYLPFDNTNGAVTTAAFANPDFANVYSANTLQIEFIDMKGVVFDTETYTVAPGTQTAVVIANQWPKTANLSGTMYILPYNPATGTTPATAAMYPPFSPITILALQGRYSQNAAGFFHSLAYVPLLTLGSYL